MHELPSRNALLLCIILRLFIIADAMNKLSRFWCFLLLALCEPLRCVTLSSVGSTLIRLHVVFLLQSVLAESHGHLDDAKILNDLPGEPPRDENGLPAFETRQENGEEYRLGRFWHFRFELLLTC